MCGASAGLCRDDLTVLAARAELQDQRREQPGVLRTEKVDTCESAIIRLGLKSTQQLLMAFAMREVFSIKVPALTAMVRALWDHSVEVGTIAFALARRTPGFDPGEAHTAGLLHDIGVMPVLCDAAAAAALLDGAGDQIEEVLGLLSA